ncbi:MAG TPA: hypothetical protein VGQ84_06590 [Gaiellaceae bacterium]|nr:hypothetical protein [Gaiellaceae bacterium]
MPIRLGLLAPLLIAATLPVWASGCNSSEQSEPTRPATTGTSTRTETSAGGIDTLEGAGTEPVSVQPEGKKTALLERVSVGRHEGYDRVVFQFKDVLPGYRVEYVKPPLRQDGSGNVIKVSGEVFVHVRMELASGFDLSKNEGELVYKGPRRIGGKQAGTSVIVEAVQISDFEAVLSWAIGLSDRVDFRVTTLDDPARLVVDFRNH